MRSVPFDAQALNRARYIAQAAHGQRAFYVENPERGLRARKLAAHAFGVGKRHKRHAPGAAALGVRRRREQAAYFMKFQQSQTLFLIHEITSVPGDCLSPA